MHFGWSAILNLSPLHKAADGLFFFVTLPHACRHLSIFTVPDHRLIKHCRLAWQAIRLWPAILFNKLPRFVRWTWACVLYIDVADAVLFSSISQLFVKLSVRYFTMTKQSDIMYIQHQIARVTSIVVCPAQFLLFLKFIYRVIRTVLLRIWMLENTDNLHQLHALA